MDTHPHHHAIIERVSTSLNVWSLTSDSHPVAIGLIGQPTVDEPHGYMALAAQAKSLAGTALTLCSIMEPSPQRLLVFPGWRSPASCGFVIINHGDDHSRIVVYTLSGATHGDLVRSGHPEVPAKIDLQELEIPRWSLTTEEHAAKLLSFLVDQTRLELML